MASSTSTLLGLILVFWGFWMSLASYFHRSWIPVVPFYPIVLFLLGVGINYLQDWAGTVVVALIHMGLVVNILKGSMGSKQKRKKCGGPGLTDSRRGRDNGSPQRSR